MTLCLAASLCGLPQTSGPGEFDEIHQLTLYNKWRNEGYMSAVDVCFDIGGTTRSALTRFQEKHAAGVDRDGILQNIAKGYGKDMYSGNGSLMRLLPVGLAYWHDETSTKAFARRSSVTTHPNATCQEACEVWAGAIAMIMKNATATSAVNFTKLDLLAYFSNFPYTSYRLQALLSTASTIPSNVVDPAEREAWFSKNHPLLKLIKETQGPASQAVGSKIIDPSFPYYIPSAEKLSSAGIVWTSALAALYCFFATKTFEEGAITAVNLADDADTVGAIYAGLAGCWYAYEDTVTSKEDVFWTERVRRWRGMLVKRSLVEEVAENLILREERLRKGGVPSER
ncbi:ADP-ribosylglycohydrolase [Agrocybe pediades]|nr:ADP-ribosylglycohydrolase [Agrocybe pediades]